jgi:hypothetical protein
MQRIDMETGGPIDAMESFVVFSCQVMAAAGVGAAGMSELRYGLVNFEFTGIQSLGPPPTLPLTLKNGVGVAQVVIRSVGSDDRILREVKLRKAIEVTSELIVPARSIGRANRLASDLVLILSAARGTTVNWIYRAGFSVMARSYTAPIIIDSSSDIRRLRRSMLTVTRQKHRKRSSKLRSATCDRRDSSDR